MAISTDVMAETRMRKQADSKKDFGWWKCTTYFWKSIIISLCNFLKNQYLDPSLEVDVWEKASLWMNACTSGSTSEQVMKTVKKLLSKLRFQFKKGTLAILTIFWFFANAEYKF